MPLRPLPFVVIMLAGVAGAKTPSEELATAVQRCAATAEAQARLRCYDADVAPLASRGAATTSGATPVSAEHESAERLLRFDLANGQVWRQMTEEHLLIKLGDPVTISKAMFGSYLLATSGGSSTRVKRIR